MPEKKLQLNLGCGPDKRAGWINIDAVKAFEPDIVHDLNNPLPFDDASVDAVSAEGLLEHFDKYARIALLYDWARVLKTGGQIHLIVPDFEKMLKKYSKFGFNNFIDTIFGENMFDAKVYTGHFGNHKFAYSKKTLTEFCRLFGIEPVSNETRALNIHFTGEKIRHVSFEEVDRMEVYAHANACGLNKPLLPYRYIREKIGEYHHKQDKGMPGPQPAASAGRK